MGRLLGTRVYLARRRARRTRSQGVPHNQGCYILPWPARMGYNFQTALLLAGCFSDAEIV
jgi:hypothetical protein